MSGTEGNGEARRQASRAPTELFASAGLLEDCRTKWQYGDWTALTALEQDHIREDPDRGKIAILIAAAHAQNDQFDQARRFAKQALAWGCSREIAARVLISGAQNSLARVACSLQEDSASVAHFEAAVALVEPRADVRLLAQTRRQREIARMGFLEQALDVLGADIALSEQDQAQDPDSLLALKGSLQALRAEIQALQKRRSPLAAAERPQIRPAGEGPVVVAAAGVPRSGSTWVFNAVRLLCSQAGLSCHAEWCEDYQPSDHADCAVHLVKLHNPDQLSFPVHKILTTRRDLVERLASLLRMGWVKEDPASLRKAANGQANLEEYWARRSDNETWYGDILEQPEQALQTIAGVLDIPCDDTTAKTIAEQLRTLPSKSLKQNKHGHDAKTLLHPNHQASEALRREYQEIVQTALSQVSE